MSNDYKPNHVFKPAGFVRIATIQSVDFSLMKAEITFNLKTSDPNLFNSGPIFAQLPVSFLSSSGGFIGGGGLRGSVVAVAQKEGGGDYIIIAFLSKDPSASILSFNSKVNIPDLSKEDTIYIQSKQNIGIELDKSKIKIGDPINYLTFDIDRAICLDTFDKSYKLTEASREITGTILRDKRPNTILNNILRNSDTIFDDTLKEIGMDPISNIYNSTYSGNARNPARVEKREVIYEFVESAQVQSNDIELQSYSSNDPINITGITNRRASRVDALSLSLVSPNYLIETIKGTVVDSLGNILDINIDIIPIGKDDLSLDKIKTTSNQSDTNKNIYEQIKRAERRSLAYHFEINSRKELQGSGPPDINNQDNFARNRSRFAIDIDKEGQIKLNIPASSNTGNIPLLTRYENFSTVNPNTESQDPNDLNLPDDYKDILIESFGFDGGQVQLTDEHENDVGPIDRFSDDSTHIHHGMVYHDILKTCQSFTEINLYDPQEFESTTIIDPNSEGHLEAINPIVSDKIIISGTEANAGGRSASLNFDGSIDLNIGANTVDEQSMWLDTEGGIVSNIGADKNGISLAASIDGDILLELGFNDSEENLTEEINGNKRAGPKVFDLRVADGAGNLTVFRIDKTGLSITTQGRYVIYSSQDMMFRSSGKIELDGEQVVINGRQFLKDEGAGYIR